MTQLGPFLVLIGLAAVALAALGAMVAWFNQENRRMRRGLRHVLKGDPHAQIIAHGSGRGAGFNFTSNTMAVTWDAGSWCLIYHVEELLGLELIVDGQVAGRAYRGEPRRPLDVLGGAERQVVLRLVFDDPRHADFVLELWSAARARRRGAPDANEAVEEGNRWLARVESVFRRKPAPLSPQAARRSTPRAMPQATAPAQAQAAPAHRPTPPPGGRQELPFEEGEAPWDEDVDDQARL
ncbi:hypothetical protein LJR225_001108 [Phenylobacterium sp. LjRoot225]|uniref:hypothetical protein n=1 Tax=Phenylobacterium sp. LjRoot225 TaxID=3342285 RepID=UPI003ECEEFA7